MCSPGTCSWSKVTTSQPLANSRSAARSVCVPMRTSAATSAALSSGRLGEHAQRLAQGDGGLVGHPGQLAATHHADDGQTGSGIHNARQPIRAPRTRM